MGYFHCSTATRSTRRFPWHVLSKQRSCAPFNGIPINTDVGNPTAPFTMALERQASFMRQVGTHDSICLYKRIRILLSHLRLLPPPPTHLLRTQAPTPKFALQPSIHSRDVRSGGKWMVSSVTEGRITKLRKAGYLSNDIAHRLPEVGQLLPTPRPEERVVFLPHFLRGLGFPLHPFVRGIMFYYGLDFHELAPNFVLNISAFIVVCEAFLRNRPHFGLWLKTFNVKPKVVSGTQAECGGV